MYGSLEDMYPGPGHVWGLLALIGRFLNMCVGPCSVSVFRF